MPAEQPPILIVQLSDPHIGADWGDGDPVVKLAAAVEAVARMDPAPDVVVVSGDLADHGSDEEYELVARLLDPLGIPTYVLPGNHDDRGALRRQFGVHGEGAEPIQYAVELGRLRMLLLDTTRPGAAAGALDGGRLEWLDAELAQAPEVPTLLVMHHPPIVTGVPGWDTLGLAASDRAALAEIVGRHPHVLRIAAGHLHRTMTAELGGRSVLAVPSTYVQALLDFNAHDFPLADEPAGFALHAMGGDGLVSHIQPVD